MTRPPLVLTALLVAASATINPVATAAELHIELDPEATSISFTLGATLHTVEGRISLASGSLDLDRESGTFSGEIVVDATSADTGNDSRDEDMHTKVLMSDTYPRIVVRPERLTGEVAEQGTSQVKLTGQMELAGTPHQITVPLDVTVDGNSFSATAEFTVPYVEWGLEDPSRFLLRVDKVVDVTVKTEGTIVGADPQQPAGQPDLD
jgi:polyisoprenoid-binding protein YceI